MSVFLALHMNGKIKICSAFEDLSAYKMSLSHVDWCKFCIHLRSLNVRHFRMFQATGLRSVVSRSPPTVYPRRRVSYNQLIGSEVIGVWVGGGQMRYHKLHFLL
jgi:hypothetical protein